MRETATLFKVLWLSTKGSLDERASNLFLEETKGYPVSALIFFATSSAYPCGVFNPVPTAVPPNAKERNISADFSILKILF